jgi:hypothetical protein
MTPAVTGVTDAAEIVLTSWHVSAPLLRFLFRGKLGFPARR